MKTEAIITCVNYADFLAETLPHNRTMFDRMVVVTAPEDQATRRVCEFWNVQCHVSDCFEARWGEFHKAKGINEGLALLAKDGWVMHLDADILCPPLTRQLLETADLDPSCLYGFDRHVCRGHDQWRTFLAMPQLQHENEVWIHLDKFPLGTRLMMGKQGYIPIGFAQLWNPGVSGVSTYPDQHTTAARTDVQFAMKWPRSKRGFVPEVVMYHLESNGAEKGANWSGRKTARFGHAGEARPEIAPARRGHRQLETAETYC